LQAEPLRIDLRTQFTQKRFVVRIGGTEFEQGIHGWRGARPNNFIQTAFISCNIVSE
jgi:hypothetical protein